MKRALPLVTGLSLFGCIAIACVGSDPSIVAGGDGDSGSPETGPGVDANDDVAVTDASADADAAPKKPCTPNQPFTIIAPVSELNAAGNNDGGDPIFTTQARLSPDENTVYLASNRDLVSRLYTASRSDKGLAFGTVTPVIFDQAFNEALFGPTIGADPNTILFCELITNPSPPFVVVNESKRAGANWGTPTTQPAGAISLGHKAGPVYVTPDLLTMVFDGEVDALSGGRHRVLFESTRTLTSDTFATHTQLTPLDSDQDQIQPALSADKLTIYFATNRATSDYDVWMAQRTTPTAAFGSPVPVTGVNHAGTDDIPSWISPDQCTLYFDGIGLSTQLRVYKAVRTPPP